MSNHDNHRRGESKRTEHGSRWDTHSGGNVSRSSSEARSKWKKLRHRAERRTGTTPSRSNQGTKRVRPVVLPSTDPEVVASEEGSGDFKSTTPRQPR